MQQSKRHRNTFRISKPVRDPRTQMYYARVGVPVALRDLLWKRELKRSLRTKDNHEARLRFASVYQEFLITLDKARCELAGATVSPQPNLNSISPTHANSSTGIPLSIFFSKYRAFHISASQGSKDAVRRTMNDYSTTIKRYIMINGDVNIDDISREQVCKFRDMLLQLPSRAKQKVKRLDIAQQIAVAKSDNLSTITPNTVKKLLMALSSVLQYGVDGGILEFNPAHGVASILTRRKKKIVNGNKGFTLDQIDTIFSSYIFKSGYKPQRTDHGKAIQHKQA